MTASRRFPAAGALLVLLAVSGAGAAEISPAIRDLIAGGHFSEARRQCLQVTALNSSDVDHWICVARMSAWLGEYATALEGYNSALTLSPNHPEALLGKALVLIWQKQFDPAQALLEQVQSAAPASAEVEVAFAQLERGRGRRREAYVHAMRAAELDGTSADARALVSTLEEPVPVVLRFGMTRDYYSFTRPGMLESTAIDYERPESTVSLLFEKSDHFGQRNTRGGAAWRLRFNKRWTLHAQGMIGPGGDVYPSLDMTAGAAAQLDKHLVIGLEFRSLTFSRTGVQALSPSLEYYWTKHPVWAQVTLHETRSQYQYQTAGSEDWTVAAQINSQITHRWLVNAGLGSGGENFINWSLGQIGGIHEKSAFGGMEYRLTRRYTAGFSYGFAARSNNLTQQTLGVNLAVRL